MTDKIDFVITWVDGNDKNWLSKKAKYSTKGVDDGKNRYRDYGLLKNWFDRVWKYAPWVNNVFLVTDSQAPNWAKEDSRITVVNHSEFIPKQYLPTFNSSVIELNLWRIKQLSEHFVYFNDDMYLCGEVNPGHFFSEEGLPVLNGAQNAISPNDDFSKMMFNNMVYVNKINQNKKQVILQNISKYFSIKYGLKMLTRSILCLPYAKWLGFYEDHLAYPLLKSWFEHINQSVPNIITSTSLHRFRDARDYTIWAVKNDFLASGNFKPRSSKFGAVVNIKNSSDIDNLKKIISRHKIIVLNDDIKDNFETLMVELKQIMKVI